MGGASASSWHEQPHVQENVLQHSAGIAHVDRWPLPVICRDTNYLHQAELRLMMPEDIVEFLHDELYGEDWSSDRLERALEDVARWMR